MPKFGNKSSIELSTCHPKLQKLFKEVVKEYDCSVLCGYRGQIAQDEAFEKGRSKVKYPNGKHNKIPSLAIDVAPYPIDWDDIERFCHFAGYVQRVAEEMGVKLEWGGSWKNFKDYPHWELKEM